VAAAGLGLLAIGAASNAVVVVPGVIVCLAAVVGWLSRAWSEDPRYTPRFGARLTTRLVRPVGIPVAVILLVATIAVSLSRVLLAVSETGARVVAISFAVVILGSAFVVAYQERLARAALTALTVFAFVAVIAAGAAGAAHGERKIEKKTGVAATTSTTTTTTTSSSAKASSATTTTALRITGAY
jgi:hypothetical protein